MPTMKFMTARGMGALYSHGHNLERLRTLHKVNAHEAILKRYYDPHHTTLTAMVDTQLASEGHALIIDCHSFASQRLTAFFDRIVNRDDPTAE